MRTWALLVVTFLSSVFAAAADQSPSPPAPAQTNHFSSATIQDGANIDGASLIRPESEDGACFKLRTYVVKREGIGDSTRMVKYYTCQRASKYGVKKADDPTQDRR